METINRQEILASSQYWVAKTQISLFRLAIDFMRKHNLNRKQLAEYLGVTPGYITQLLNGDYDHRLSKFFELVLAFGAIPDVRFTSATDYITAQQESTYVLKVETQQVLSGQEFYTNGEIIEKSVNHNVAEYSHAIGSLKDAA